MGNSPLNSRTVLIVEDDADARKNLAHLLHLHGHMAIQAANVWEALDQIEATTSSSPLILLDLDMPDLDRTHLLELLREPDIGDFKVIVITSCDAGAVKGATTVLGDVHFAVGIE